MKILVLHNRYKFEGGEEAVVSSEIDLLRKNKHDVIVFELNNEDIDKFNIIRKLSLPIHLIWSVSSYRKVKEIIKKEKPDIVHVHNTFFLLSPSIYYACKGANVPIVQTLHNYRFICPLATLYRAGNICCDCLDKDLMMSVIHKCGSKSLAWRISMLLTLKVHYKMNTFKKLINTYIALSEFSKQQFIQAGFNGEKIKVKPNFINFDPGYSLNRGNFALYVGRFSPEKGVDVLLEAWKNINYLSLKIIGTGNEFDDCRLYAINNSLNVEFMGQVSNSEVIDQIKKCLVIVVPSKCNENFPRILVEAFACGVPVIASKRGALSEIIEDGKTGFLFNPEDPMDLAEKIRLIYKNRDLAGQMGANARKEFENKYTPEKNFQILIDIYKEAINRS